MVAVREELGLLRLIGAAAVGKIKAGPTVLARYFLRAQVLFHGHRKIGATLDGGVIADDDAFPALYTPDASDKARAVDRLVIHRIGRKRRQLKERRPVVDQIHDSVARQQLPAGDMALP